MPREIILDRAFRRRSMWRSVGKGLPLLIGLVLLWCDWGNFGLETWVAMLSFVAGILIWAWEDRMLVRNYHCPRCGRRLPPPANEGEGTPVRYVCEACDVEWDTGLRF